MLPDIFGEKEIQLPATREITPPAQSAGTLSQSAGSATALRRVEDHRVNALRNPNPLAAVIGTYGANLYEIGIQLSDMVCNGMKERPLTLLTCDEYSHALDRLERLAKHAGQFVNLEIRLADPPAHRND